MNPTEKAAELAGGEPQPQTLRGVYCCTNCPNVELTEREVSCWECGKGEMVYREINHWQKPRLSATTPPTRPKCSHCNDVGSFPAWSAAKGNHTEKCTCEAAAPVQAVAPCQHKNIRYISNNSPTQSAVATKKCLDCGDDLPLPNRYEQLKNLAALKDEDIDTSDIPPLTEAQLATAEWGESDDPHRCGLPEGHEGDHVCKGKRPSGMYCNEERPSAAPPQYRIGEHRLPTRKDAQDSVLDWCEGCDDPKKKHTCQRREICTC